MHKYKDEHEHHEHEHHHAGHTHGEDCACNQCALGSEIKIILHEGAVSASFRSETSLSEHAVNHIISETMVKLAGWVREKQGIIGHIKAVVRGGAGVKMFSITKDTLTAKDNGAEPESPFEVLFTAIVFNIKIDEIERELIKIYNEFI